MRVDGVASEVGGAVASGGEAELFGGALAGLPAPEVHGELSRHSDDGFLAGGSGGACAIGQDGEAFVDGWVAGLEADEPPG